jgi:hypothetical protein
MQKIVYDKDGDQIDEKFLHEVEENTNGSSLKQSNQTPTMNIQTFAAQYDERQNWGNVQQK